LNEIALPQSSLEQYQFVYAFLINAGDPNCGFGRQYSQLARSQHFESLNNQSKESNDIA
jgi:hypothetical protein